MDYILHIVVFVGVYTVLAVSLDLLAGRTGLLSIAHAAFFGIGSYATAIITTHYSGSFVLGILAGMGLAAVASLLIAVPSLRLHGDYLVIGTLAFQMIAFGVFNNWIELTGGPLGIAGIPQPAFMGFCVQSNLHFAIVAVVFAALAYLIVWLITRSPFGRVLCAIREDEVVAKALGKNTVMFKVTVFGVSAALAAAAGSLYAHYVSYIDAASFTVMESILVISMLIVGGMGSLWGPLVGAIVLVALPEALRVIGLPSSVAANLRQILYGGLLVVMMMFRPRGLVGRYAFGR